MSVIKIRLYQFLEGNRSHVLANIYALGAGRGEKGKAHQIRNALIPAGDFADADAWPWGTFEVPPGHYLVEAVLPSGEHVEEEVYLEEEGKIQEVRLLGPSSPHEWLSWQTFQDSATPSRLKQLEVAHIVRRISPLQQGVEIVALPPQSLKPPVSLETPLVSWSSMLSLVNSTNHAASACFRTILDSSRTSALGITVTPVVEGQSEPAVTVHHFAAPGSVTWRAYDTRRCDISYDKEKVSRFFVVISVGNIIREIASLPIPWLQVDQNGEALVDLLVSNAELELPSAPESMRNPLSKIVVQDRIMAGMFGYLTSGDLPRAAILASQGQARDLLFYKWENPIAAAAGAYILISGQQVQHIFTSEGWHNWVRNLMNYFPWMADGAIQYGSLQLWKGNDTEARKVFLNAFERGLPFYSVGVRWLLDGLTILADDAAREKHDDTEVVNALNTVRVVARHTNVAQPFTIVRVGALR
jgi:hypothetical protein